MKILFLTWKDIKHPFAGGAEKIMLEYIKGLIKKGHEITWFAYSFEGCAENENIDGINIIRKFNPYSSLLFFANYYKKNFASKYDLIIDEAGGLPFLSPLFEKNIPIILFVHHIGDKEWDYSLPPPLSQIGKQLYFWLFRQYKNTKTITVSDSTKNELIKKFGFKNENIKVIENACDIEPIAEIDFEKKEDSILFLGRLMPIKRAEHAIKAFGKFIKSSPYFQNYRLDIIGNDQDKKYVNNLKKLVQKLNLEKNVNFLGHIDRKEFKDFMLKQKFILVPSMKEGFGLIVLEANSYGMPAIGYDVAGLRDSIKEGINGYLINDGDFESMGNKLIEILSDEDLYKNINQKSLEYIKTFKNWNQKVDEFEEYILNIKIY